MKNSFANLISKKELSKMSNSKKDDFYALQGITKTFKIQGAPLNKICENIIVTDYSLNILEEITDGYLSRAQFLWDTSILKNDLNIELELAFNKKDKIKSLKKCYNYHKKKLKSIELSYYYFLPDNEFKKDIKYYITKLDNPTFHNYYFSPKKQLNKMLYNGFKEFFYNEMTNDKNLIKNYITTDSFRYAEYQCFKDWSNIEKSYEMIRYIKKQLKDIEDISSVDKKEKSNNTTMLKQGKDAPETIDNDNYFSNVFNSLKSENVLLNVLINFNAINENNEPIKRKFQPPCEAFFRVANTEKYSIFKGNVFLMDYIQFLNDKFNTKIGRKLSNGEKHESKVKEFLKPYLLN